MLSRSSVPQVYFQPLKRLLARLPDPAFAAVAAAASFAAYFAMYGFRKPFTAGTYDGMFLGTGVALKTAFVLSQIFGYTLSKYVGVKVCSEAGGNRRGALLVSFIVFAELSLVLFGTFPGAWRVIPMFLNGLPLGMVWGLVVSYLEGRRSSDLVLAGLCGSFIVSSAVVKDVGRWLMGSHGVSETWMPAATGLLFLPLFLIAVGVLAHLPPPTAADEAQRAHRQPMDKHARHAFLRRFLPGLAGLFAFYFLLTAYRDFRDNYGVEIFLRLGYPENDSTLFTRTEIPVAVGSLLGLAAINLIRDNRRALAAAFAIMIFGMVVLLGSTLLLKSGAISGLAWMVCTGLGAYLAYVPFNAVLFERLMAATGSVGTAVFGIQLADSIGYTGSVATQLYKDLAEGNMSRLRFFENFSLGLSVAGVTLLILCAVYFHHRAHPYPSDTD